jgi:hypothetical protein
MSANEGIENRSFLNKARLADAGLWLSLKGTGFSPYIKCSKMNLGFSPWGSDPSN